MISVICPCYNAESYIEKTIQSLLSQTKEGFDFEIIFIDDGSTDKTFDKLKDSIKLFSEKDIMVIVKTQNNYGAGSARNLGIKYANFRYIAFLDADDIWKKNKLQICHKFILKNPSHNLFSHNERYIKLDGTISQLTNGLFAFEDISKSLYIKNTLSTSAVVLDKKLINDYGSFDVTLKSSQDYDLWLKISPSMKPMHIDLILGEYNELENSITSRYYLFRFIDQLKIAYRYRKYTTMMTFIKKIIKILLSKQWVLGLLSKKHGF